MEIVKLANRELIYLNSGIESSRGLSGARFNFALVKTQRRFEKDIKALQAASEASKDYVDYKRKLFEIMRSFSVMGKDGQPETIISGGEPHFKIAPEHTEKFKEELETLNKKYSLDIKKHKEQSSVYNKQILREVVEIDIHTINKNDFPDNITLGHVDGILPLIEPIKYSEKDKGSIRFTNLAIVRYRNFFLPIMNLDKPEVVVGMVENLRTLAKMRDEILSSKVYIDYFDAYEEARIELCRRYAKSDIYGNPSIIGGEFEIPKIAEFNDELEKLKKKYKKIVEPYEEMMNKEVDVPVNLISLDLLPKDISGEQMQVIADFIRG